MRNAKEGIRDCAVDTRFMASFGRGLFEYDWDVVHEADIRKMNDGKVGRPFVYSDALMSWSSILRRC